MSRPFTPEDDAIIREHHECLTYGGIARKLHRPTSEVRARMYDLGLCPPHEKPAHMPTPEQIRERCLEIRNKRGLSNERYKEENDDAGSFEED